MTEPPWKPGDDDEDEESGEESEYTWDDSDLAPDVELFARQMLDRDAIIALLKEVGPWDVRRFLRKWQYSTRKRRRW